MTAEYVSPSLLVAGRWVAADARESSAIINPATGAEIGRVPHATAADIDAALDAAAKGFVVWKAMSAEKRADILLRAAQLLRDQADRLARVLTLEQGKPVAEARAEVLRSASLIEWDANEGRRAYGRIVPSDAGLRHLVLRQPIGPVAGFSPWNFPSTSPARKLGGALAAGCSVILKASEETPASAWEVVRCLVEAGIPEGVVGLLYGDPAAISERMIASPVIRAITFTGSVPVGKQLAGMAASRMKPAVMELGGHAPVIVCDDVDPVRAGAVAAQAKFRNAGQICTAPTRFLVQEDQHDAFVDSFAAAAASLRIGDGLDPATQMGPLASARRISAMDRIVADARERGGRVVTGGERIGNQGFFFQPTVLADLDPDSLVLNEEPFGPLAPVVRYAALDDAIAIANRLPYGLASYAFTNSTERAAALIDRVESGIMSINHLGGSQPDVPFGGVKDSGFGREGGMEGLEAFTVTKFISQKSAF